MVWWRRRPEWKPRYSELPEHDPFVAAYTAENEPLSTLRERAGHEFYGRWLREQTALLITASGGTLIPDVCSIILNSYAPPLLSVQIEWLRILYKRLVTPDLPRTEFPAPPEHDRYRKATDPKFEAVSTDVAIARLSATVSPPPPPHITPSGGIATGTGSSGGSGSGSGGASTAPNLRVNVSWCIQEKPWFRGKFENLAHHHPASAISPRQLYRLFQWARIEYGRQPTEDGARWSAPVNEPVWEAIRCGLAILLDTQQPYCWCSQCNEGGAAGTEYRASNERIAPIQFTQLWIQRVPPFGTYFRRRRRSHDEIKYGDAGLVLTNDGEDFSYARFYGSHVSELSTDDEKTGKPRRPRKPKIDPVMIDNEEEDHLDDDGQLVYRIGWVCPQADTTVGANQLGDS